MIYGLAIPNNDIKDRIKELVEISDTTYCITTDPTEEEIELWRVIYGIDIQPIPIVINDIQGALLHNSDFTKITCYELTNLTISGTLEIPDRTFAVPIRRDDGRLFLFPANVVNGEFSTVINIPTTGQFIYSDVECNIDLPEGTFTVDTLKIDCLRNTQ